MLPVDIWIATIEGNAVYSRNIGEPSVIFERTPSIFHLGSPNACLRLGPLWCLSSLVARKFRKKTIIHELEEKRKKERKEGKTVAWKRGRKMIYKEVASGTLSSIRGNFSPLPWNYSYIFIIDFASGLWWRTRKKKEGRKGTTITRWGDAARRGSMCRLFHIRPRFRATSLWRGTRSSLGPDGRWINCSLWGEINEWGRR